MPDDEEKKTWVYEERLRSEGQWPPEPSRQTCCPYCEKWQYTSIKMGKQDRCWRCGERFIIRVLSVAPGQRETVTTDERKADD